MFKGNNDFMKIVCYITFILGVLSACKNSPVMDVGEVRTINCSKITDDTFKLSDIASSFSIIPLETNDSCLIGEISKLEFFNENIFVLDKTYSARLFVFSKNGKFLYDIGKRGTAPDEYIQINDFSISRKKNLIYVLCDKKKVFSYSLSGQYMGQIALDLSADAMEYQDDSFYFICDQVKRGNLIVTDMKGNVKYEDFANEHMGENLFMLIHPFLRRDSTLLYRRYLDNNIYEIDSDKSTVRYKVDFGKNKIELDDLKDIPHQKVKDKLTYSRGKIKYLVENKDYMQAVFFDNNMPCISVYDKKNTINNVYFFKNYIDDLSGLPSPLFEFVTERNEFVAVIQPSIIREMDDLTEMGQMVFRNVDVSDDSNPILYIIKTK